MKQISSFDLNLLLKDFKILEGSRIDSFYFDNETFFIKFYVKGSGATFLENKVSKYIFMSNKKSESSKLPNSFVAHLRKYLKNGILQKIDLIPNERILKLEISKKAPESEKIETLYMFIELFANGNIILTDSNNIIKNSLIKRHFKDRAVKVKQMYELPPKVELDILNFNKDKFLIETQKSDLSIVKFLAIKFGIGGKYSEEIVSRMEIDKNKLVQEISEEDIKLLEENINKLIKEKIEPKIIMKNEKMHDFIPFDFKTNQLETKNFKDYNECIKTYFEQFREEIDIREDKFAKELKKLQNRLNIQLKQQKKIKVDYEKYNTIGNTIYENYSLVEDLLNSINKAAKEKGWDYVLEKIKNDEKLSKLIKKLNYKNNEIILNL